MEVTPAGWAPRGPGAPRRFGGVGNVRPPASPRRDSPGGRIWTGEAGGIQDALWGFGIRYAILSGRLAVQATEDGVEAEAHRRRRVGLAIFGVSVAVTVAIALSPLQW